MAELALCVHSFESVGEELLIYQKSKSPFGLCSKGKVSENRVVVRQVCADHVEERPVQSRKST